MIPLSSLWDSVNYLSSQHITTILYRVLTNYRPGNMLYRIQITHNSYIMLLIILFFSITPIFVIIMSSKEAVNQEEYNSLIFPCFLL